MLVKWCKQVLCDALIVQVVRRTHKFDLPWLLNLGVSTPADAGSQDFPGGLLRPSPVDNCDALSSWPADDGNCSLLLSLASVACWAGSPCSTV